jgi:hypothetical protein
MNNKIVFYQKRKTSKNYQNQNISQCRDHNRLIFAAIVSIQS